MQHLLYMSKLASPKLDAGNSSLRQSVNRLFIDRLYGTVNIKSNHIFSCINVPLAECGKGC